MNRGGSIIAAHLKRQKLPPIAGVMIAMKHKASSTNESLHQIPVGARGATVIRWSLFPYSRFRFFMVTPCLTALSPHQQRRRRDGSTMDLKPQRDGAILALDLAIEAVDLAEKISSITPAKATFGSVSAILVIIKVCSVRIVQAGPLRANRVTYTGLHDRRSGLCRPRTSLC
jgi:hypothetical protein